MSGQPGGGDGNRRYAAGASGSTDTNEEPETSRSRQAPPGRSLKPAHVHLLLWHRTAQTRRDGARSETGRVSGLKPARRLVYSAGIESLVNSNRERQAVSSCSDGMARPAGSR